MRRKREEKVRKGERETWKTSFPRLLNCHCNRLHNNIIHISYVVFMRVCCVFIGTLNRLVSVAAAAVVFLVYACDDNQYHMFRQFNHIKYSKQISLVAVVHHSYLPVHWIIHNNKRPFIQIFRLNQLIFMPMAEGLWITCILDEERSIHFQRYLPLIRCCTGAANFDKILWTFPNLTSSGKISFRLSWISRFPWDFPWIVHNVYSRSKTIRILPLI